MSVEDLTNLAAKLRAVPELGTAIAKASVRGVLDAAKKTAAAGTDPEGKAWAPRKKDGKRALVHAADALSASSSGDVVELVLSGVEVFHQRKRRIIPDGGAGLPPAIVDAIERAARGVLAAKVAT